MRFNPFLLFILFLILFFSPFFFLGKLPVPSDSLLGLYHPFRDVSWDGYREVPYKNFLITDPILQQIPWRKFTTDQLKEGRIPLWNPYNFSGTPHLANLQSAVFSPFNILFFILPFKIAWSILIFLQPFLAGLFLYLYLRFFNLSKVASLLGATAFSFSGFFVSWLLWGTVLYSALFLSLILLSIEKLKFKFSTFWFLIFIASLVFSIFAGHLQTTFYVFLVSLFYLVVRTWGKKFFLSLLFGFIFAILISQVQLLPTFEFILNSSRGKDLPPLPREDWFLPPKHLIQILAPDFFGNPTTLNYWGVFNYGEFVSYIGIMPLIFALYAIFFLKSRKTLFFTLLGALALLFALPNPISQIPFIFKIPFIASSQPSRIIFLLIFSLSVLSAFGFDNFSKKPKAKPILLIFASLLLIVLGLFISTFLLKDIYPQEEKITTYLVARRNLIVPMIIFLTSFLVLIFIFFQERINKFLGLKHRVISSIFLTIFMLITLFDLFRFGKKFIPFSKNEWFFPKTKIINFLEGNTSGRFLTTDRRIFPPNLSTFYTVHTPEGYDPLYIKNYAELISAFEKEEPNPKLLSFNRILRPQKLNEQFLRIFGISHIISFDELNKPKLKKVFEEGQTKIFSNEENRGRVFVVSQVVNVPSKEEELKKLLDPNFNIYKKATTRENYSFDAGGKVEAKSTIISDFGNRVLITASSDEDGFLVFSDNFYPGWKAKVNDQESKVYQVDYSLKGVEIPKGNSKVLFYFDPASFKIGFSITIFGLFLTGLYLWIRKKLVS